MSVPTSNPSGSNQHADEVNFVRYLQILADRKWVLVGTTVAVFAAVMAWTANRQKVYQSSCVLEYDPNPPRPLGSEVEDVADQTSNFWALQEFFQTQNQVIASRAIAERVVESESLHHDLGFLTNTLQGGQEPPEPWTVSEAAVVLQSRTTVEPVPDTRLVRVQVRDVDPDRARSLSDAIADEYVEKTMEDRMGSTVTALNWLGTQLQTLRGELEHAELELHDFKREHNILSVSLEDRQNLVAQEIERLSGALHEARAARLAMQARVGTLGDQTNRGAYLSRIEGGESILRLTEQIAERTAERAQRASRYGANHPAIREIDASLAALRAERATQIESTSTAISAELTEVRRLESSLRRSLNDAHEAGIELNLREIEYTRLNRELESKARLYTLVHQRAAETDLTRMLQTTHVRVLDRALTPVQPVSPNIMLSGIAGLALGGLAGIALVLLLHFADRRIRSTDQVEAMGLTVLGVLPAFAADGAPPQSTWRPVRAEDPPGHTPSFDLLVHDHPMSTAAECCRTVRTNLMFTGASTPTQALLVTSAQPREGKSTVATSLAISIAQSGKRVLLVDTDLRRPRLHRAFEATLDGGVTTVLVGEETLEDAVIETQVPNLDFLPAGPVPPNPAELFHTEGFAALIASIRARYDQVIFDSSPLTAVTDAAIIAPQVDGALIVLRAGLTSRDALSTATRQLRDINANLLGAIVNDVEGRRAGYYGFAGTDQYYRREGYYHGVSEATSPPGHGA